MALSEPSVALLHICAIEINRNIQMEYKITFTVFDFNAVSLNFNINIEFSQENSIFTHVSPTISIHRLF